MRKRLHIFTVLVWVLFSTVGHGQTLPRESAMVDFLLEYLAIRYPDHSFGTFLYVAAKKQKMYLIENGLISGEYTVSTAASGLGSERGSFRTPTGLHRIADKVGEGLPANSIIAQKMADGRKAEIVYTGLDTGKDLITSRVLHLDGMEENFNKGGNSDSYSRGIFIHGTHEEGRLGTPASKGCIRMGNEEIIALFRKVEVDTFVIILNN